MELYDKKYVYFEWDDKLEGKKGFVGTDISYIKKQVNKCTDTITEIYHSSDNTQPFTTGYYNYSFAYYDPNYEVKKAYNEGKKLQWKYRNKKNWKDWDSEECPEFRDDTCGYELRVKPDDIDYDTGVINDKILPKPLIEEPEKSDNYKEFFIETEKIIQSEHTVEDKLITILYNIETIIRSIRGCSNIDIYNFVRTVYKNIRPNIVESVKNCRCKESTEDECYTNHEAKDRLLTNKELSMWLAKGNGQWKSSVNSVDNSYKYLGDNYEVPDTIRIRKWEDEDWHEPTYNYCFVGIRR